MSLAETPYLPYLTFPSLPLAPRSASASSREKGKGKEKEKEKEKEEGKACE